MSTETTRPVWSATPTPFHADGTLDEESVVRLVEHHVALGVNALFVGGSCGEGPFTPTAQRTAMVAATKRAAGDRLHIAAQVTDTSAARVSDNMRLMAEAGADSLVVAPPHFLGFCNRAFVRRYFVESIAGAPLPVGCYIRPPVPGMELDLPLWREIAVLANVRFIKDSSADPALMRAFADLRRERPELTLLTGHEFDVVSAVSGGYDGCLVGTGILNAGMMRRVLAAWDEGDVATANAWQARSNRLLHDIFRDDLTAWLAGLKYALVRLGLFANEFSHLCFPLDDNDKRRIDGALERERALVMPG